MESFLSFSLILLIIILCHGVHGVDIIADTCKKAAGPTLTYDFCVTALQSDPNSHNADRQGLGVISMKLSISNASSIQTRIKNLLNDQGKSLTAKNVLKDCLEVYSDAIPDIKDAIECLKGKDYGGANIHLSAAYDASSTCEDGFKEVGLVSPLTKENRYFSQLASIGLAITNMLH